jgi:hypothetical protein
MYHSHNFASLSALGAQWWQFDGIVSAALAIHRVPIQQKFCPTTRLTNPLTLLLAFYVNSLLEIVEYSVFVNSYKICGKNIKDNIIIQYSVLTNSFFFIDHLVPLILII